MPPARDTAANTISTPTRAPEQAKATKPANRQTDASATLPYRRQLVPHSDSPGDEENAVEMARDTTLSSSNPQKIRTGPAADAPGPRRQTPHAAAISAIATPESKTTT